MTTKICDEICNYINDSFPNESDESIGVDDDLLTMLDSLQILRMLVDLEEIHSIKVENSELTPENLGTVEKLAAFIDRKRKGLSCSTQAH